MGFPLVKESMKYDVLQGDNHTYGIEPEAIVWCFIKFGWCHDVLLDDWIIDVLDEYETRYFLCYEHIEPVPDKSETCFAAKHILRYLKGTFDYGIKYEVNQKINLKGYVNSDWADSAIDRKSTSGCCFSMGSGVISWFSRKQSCMELSTTDEEYVTSCSTICE